MTVKVAGIVAVELSSTCTVSLEPFQKHCTGLSGELPLMNIVVPTDSVIMCGSSRTGGGQFCAATPAQAEDQTTSVTCLLELKQIIQSVTCLLAYVYAFLPVHMYSAERKRTRI